MNGPLAVSPSIVRKRFERLFPITGARILEIGGYPPERAVASAQCWWSIDPRNPRNDVLSTGVVRRLCGTAEALPEEISEVDAVFACNSFQHVAGLATAYHEIGRVLRPGGLVYACFGPIWTAPDGAHIEDVRVATRRYDFWKQPTLVPAWSHLTLGEEEFQELLCELHGPDLGLALARFVSRSDWVNRISIDAHLRLPIEAGLQIVCMRGCRRFGYAYDPPDPPERFRKRVGLEAARATTGLDARALRVRDLELVLRAP